MKHLKIAMPLILATALFTSCKKENNDAVLTTQGANSSRSITSASTQKDAAGMPAIAYQVSTVPMSLNSPLQWTSGYMENSALAFDAIMVNDARCKVSYLTNTGTAVTLFSQADMDKINVPPARYENMTFTLKLVPGAGANGREGALVLNGSFLMTDMKVPVKLIIDQSVDLAAKCTQGVSLNADSMYRTNLVLSMPILSAGITTQMMNSATNENGLITISSTSNATIYQKIVNNLTNALTAQFGAPAGINTISAPGIATMHPVAGNDDNTHGSVAAKN